MQLNDGDIVYTINVQFKQNKRKTKNSKNRINTYRNYLKNYAELNWRDVIKQFSVHFCPTSRGSTTSVADLNSPYHWASDMHGSSSLSLISLFKQDFHETCHRKAGSTTTTNIHLSWPNFKMISSLGTLNHIRRLVSLIAEQMLTGKNICGLQKLPLTFKTGTPLRPWAVSPFFNEMYTSNVSKDYPIEMQITIEDRLSATNNNGLIQEVDDTDEINEIYCEELRFSEQLLNEHNLQPRCKRNRMVKSNPELDKHRLHNVPRKARHSNRLEGQSNRTEITIDDGELNPLNLPCLSSVVKTHSKPIKPDYQLLPSKPPVLPRHLINREKTHSTDNGDGNSICISSIRSGRSLPKPKQRRQHTQAERSATIVDSVDQHGSRFISSNDIIIEEDIQEMTGNDHSHVAIRHMLRSTTDSKLHDGGDSTTYLIHTTSMSPASCSLSNSPLTSQYEQEMGIDNSADEVSLVIVWEMVEAKNSLLQSINVHGKYKLTSVSSISTAPTSAARSMLLRQNFQIHATYLQAKQECDPFCFRRESLAESLVQLDPSDSVTDVDEQNNKAVKYTLKSSCIRYEVPVPEKLMHSLKKSVIPFTRRKTMSVAVLNCIDSTHKREDTCHKTYFPSVPARSSSLTTEHRGRVTSDSQILVHLLCLARDQARRQATYSRTGEHMNKSEWLASSCDQLRGFLRRLEVYHTRLRAAAVNQTARDEADMKGDTPRWSNAAQQNATGLWQETVNETQQWIAGLQWAFINSQSLEQLIQEFQKDIQHSYIRLNSLDLTEGEKTTTSHQAKLPTFIRNLRVIRFRLFTWLSNVSLLLRPPEKVGPVAPTHCCQALSTLSAGDRPPSVDSQHDHYQGIPEPLTLLRSSIATLVDDVDRLLLGWDQKQNCSLINSVGNHSTFSEQVAPPELVPMQRQDTQPAQLCTNTLITTACLTSVVEHSKTLSDTDENMDELVSVTSRFSESPASDYLEEDNNSQKQPHWTWLSGVNDQGSNVHNKCTELFTAGSDNPWSKVNSSIVPNYHSLSLPAEVTFEIDNNYEQVHFQQYPFSSANGELSFDETESSFENKTPSPVTEYTASPSPISHHHEAVDAKEKTLFSNNNSAKASSMSGRKCEQGQYDTIAINDRIAQNRIPTTVAMSSLYGQKLSTPVRQHFRNINGMLKSKSGIITRCYRIWFIRLLSSDFTKAVICNFCILIIFALTAVLFSLFKPFSEDVGHFTCSSLWLSRLPSCWQTDTEKNAEVVASWPNNAPPF